MPKPILYAPDLAQIHIAGYDFHWKGAAPAILGWLKEAGIEQGRVVDLGCGGGQWLQHLARHGYAPVGVDASAAMLRQARRLVPAAQLIRGSLEQVELPPCDVVTSLGEPLNYLNSARKFQRTLNHVARVLRPGGLFVFDVRVPPTRPIPERTHVRLADDWACIAVINEAHQTGQLTRRITTFFRRGTGFRRGEEFHKLQLIPRATITNWLRRGGFLVRTARAYGDYQLAPRQLVFIARMAG